MGGQEIEQLSRAEARGQRGVLLGEVALVELGLGMQVASGIGDLVGVAVGRSCSQGGLTCRAGDDDAAGGHGLKRASRRRAGPFVLLLDVEVQASQKPPRPCRVLRFHLPIARKGLDSLCERLGPAEKPHLEIRSAWIGEEQRVTLVGQPLVVAPQHASQDRAATLRRPAPRAPRRQRLEWRQVLGSYGQTAAALE